MISAKDVRDMVRGRLSGYVLRSNDEEADIYQFFQVPMRHNQSLTVYRVREGEVRVTVMMFSRVIRRAGFNSRLNTLHVPRMGCLSANLSEITLEYAALHQRVEEYTIFGVKIPEDTSLSLAECAVEQIAAAMLSAAQAE
jgi:hypothetical protein